MGAQPKLSAMGQGPGNIAEANPGIPAQAKKDSRFLAEKRDLKSEPGPAPGASGLMMNPTGTPGPVLVPERIKTLRNLLDQQRTLAVALARGDIAKPKAPGAGDKPETFAVKPKADAIVNEYERLVGSQLPNLLGSLSSLPAKQLSLELRPLLEHLQSSESEYSRLAVQYPFDAEWLKQIALLARVGILQIRTAQKEI